VYIVWVSYCCIYCLSQLLLCLLFESFIVVSIVWVSYCCVYCLGPVIIVSIAWVSYYVVYGLSQLLLCLLIESAVVDKIRLCLLLDSCFIFSSIFFWVTIMSLLTMSFIFQSCVRLTELFLSHLCHPVIVVPTQVSRLLLRLVIHLFILESELLLGCFFFWGGTFRLIIFL